MRFLKAGTSGENIILDPGIGFAKRKEDNLVLLARIKELVMSGFPVCLGTSRKSFIGHITGAAGPDTRLAGSLASIVPAFEAGCAFSACMMWRRLFSFCRFCMR